MEPVAVIARGCSTDGDLWELDTAAHDRELLTSVQVTTPDGQRLWATGCSGPAQQPGRRVSTAWGRNGIGPTTFIARVAADVTAVVVTLSDGTREDLTLHGDISTLGVRIAVLVHPRHLDVHRLDLIAADGTRLPEETG